MESAAIASTPTANAALAQSRSTDADEHHLNRKGKIQRGIHYLIGPALFRAIHSGAYERKLGEPIYRPLRIYALDPSGSRCDGTVAVVNVPYEPLRPGPMGALFEVIDDVHADHQHRFDLDDRAVLLEQGRRPSQSDAKFRQQMVYAVCSTTYAVFRQALGRDLAWGFDRNVSQDDSAPRLRIKTAVEGVRNAYYSKVRGELQFGTYRADDVVNGRNVPGEQVFTALSHDVIVHETSHALLDGLRENFTYPSNPDVLAFHEAFSDLVAVLQRFTYRDVVRAGLRGARGDVRSAPLLTEIAKQFGQTIGMKSSLRDAVNGTEFKYGEATAPHELGQVLVAAVFEAFSNVYAAKSKRLVKLATNGTARLPEGDLPELLIELLSEEASKLASQFLSVCIRAIDYCPPVDITFGEYLRAVITADYDLVPHDPWGYREAWLDAFRKYNVYPRDVPNLSEDAVLWHGPDVAIPCEPALSFGQLAFSGEPAHPSDSKELQRQACALGALVCEPSNLEIFGLIGDGDTRLKGDHVDPPIVQSIRSTRRCGPAGQLVFDLVAEVTQRREVKAQNESPGFDFYGGSTVILDPMGNVRYVIRKSIVSTDRMKRQSEYLALDNGQWGRGPFGKLYCEPEPFRLIHQFAGQSNG